jgi:hypothetical protein
MNPTDFATDRRALIQRMALLLGAAALPAEAFAAPARRRTAAARALSAPLYAVLTAAADTIVPATDSPGALAAKVPQVLDGMLTTWASSTTRESITEALRRIDAAARRAKGKGFAALTTAERAEMLKPHDAAALTKVPAPAGARQRVSCAGQSTSPIKATTCSSRWCSISIITAKRRLRPN